MDPDQARRLVADEPSYEWGFQEGRTCSVCGANVLAPDRDLHSRWHRALAEMLGVGWEDLARRAPRDDRLADAVDAVLNPRGLRRLSRIATGGESWRALHDVPPGAAGATALLIGQPGVVVARSADGRAEVRGGVVHVGGHRSPLADELRETVARVRDTFARYRREPPRVYGVVVAAGGLEGGDPDPSEILAASDDGLADRLAMLPSTLGYGELDALYDLARRSTTWDG